MENVPKATVGFIVQKSWRFIIIRISVQLF
nr:MAG TPA: hypothetical protein [Caudoviricetes sp.]